MGMGGVWRHGDLKDRTSFPSSCFSRGTSMANLNMALSRLRNINSNRIKNMFLHISYLHVS